MKASFKLLALGLFLVLPLAAAHAQTPSLSPIANLSMNAGTTRTLNIVAVEPEGDPITITASLPPFAALNTPTFGTGSVVTTLTLTPAAINVGDFTAAVTATAGGVSSVRVFQITVNAAGSNQAPVVSAPPYQTVTEGAALTFTVNASDADGDAITSLNPTDLPSGATFTPNGANTSASFSWTPVAGDAGEYDVQFTASNALSGTSVTHIHVDSAPVLAITPIDDVTVAGGGFASVPVHASAPPGSFITLTASLPSFGTLNPPGTGTGSVNTTISLSPPTGSAGTYHAAVTAIAGGTSVSEEFDIIVTGAGPGDNHAPVLSAPASATIAVGSPLSFDVTATDPDGDHVDLFGSALPPGSTFTDHADNTGSFSWTPVTGQAGMYVASFSGTDGRGGSGSASTNIMVTGPPPQNQPPTVTAPASRTVDEGVLLAFTVTAADPDGDPVTLSAGSVPAGASFVDNGDLTGAFSWTPGSAQSGSYTVAFQGDDGHGGTGTASTVITVNDVTGGGGGGNTVPGSTCLIGPFRPASDQSCFRIKPVEGSFALGDVVLSSITLQFHGQSIPVLPGAGLDIHCCPIHGDGDDDDGDDHGEDGHHGHGHGDVRALLRGGEHHGDGENLDLCGVSCPESEDSCERRDDDDDANGPGPGKGKGHCEHGNGHGYGHDHHGDECDDDDDGGVTCDTLGIRACFSTQALLQLFAGASLPCDLLGAEIHATLANGDTVVATFHNTPPNPNPNPHPHGDGEGDDDDQGEDHQGDGDHRGLQSAKVQPNPLNPSTMLSFTTSREGTVRVSVYDMQGRLVKTLLNEYRPAGPHTVAWDGSSNARGHVASGVYFLRIESAEGGVVRRVAVVK